MGRIIGVLLFFVGLVFIGEQALRFFGVSVQLGFPQVLGWAVVLMGSVTFLINALALFHLRHLFRKSPDASDDESSVRELARGQLEHHGGLVVFSVAAIAVGTAVGFREQVGTAQLAGAVLLLIGSGSFVQMFRKQHNEQAALRAGVDLAPQGSVNIIQCIVAFGTIGGGLYLFLA